MLFVRCSSDSRKQCGLCDAFIAEARYRAHVAECGVKKRCGLCDKEVDNLATHYDKCRGGDDPVNPVYRPPAANRAQQVIFDASSILMSKVSVNNKLN